MEMIRNMETHISDAILSARKHNEEVVLELEKKIMLKMADEKVKVDASTQTDDMRKENEDEEVEVEEEKQSKGKRSSSKEESTNPSKYAAPTSEKATAYSEKGKILFVGDSIMHNANFRMLEKVTNTTAFAAKAYAADYDIRTRKPNQNIKYVANQETRKRNPKYVVLQCPSVHITNMNTTSANDDDIKNMKKEVSEASAKMIEIAENLIKVNPSIEKVVLFDSIPRFDQQSCDPEGLKPKLARYNNEMQRKLASESESTSKDKSLLTAIPSTVTLIYMVAKTHTLMVFICMV